MILQDDTIFVKKIFYEYKVDRLLGLDIKYLDAFVDSMCWSYRNTEAAVWVNSKYQRVKSFSIKTLVVLGGALISSLRCLLKYNRYKCVKIKEQVVAVPFCGAHVRFKYLYDLIDSDVIVIYPPLFHYQHIQEHIDCFENQGHHIKIGRFRLRDIFSVAATVFWNYSRLKNCHKQIDSYFSKDYGSFASAIITSLLYRKFIDNIIKRISNDGQLRKWLFDYDFEYKYIVFNNEIKKSRKQDITYHIQHGSFFGYNDAYCNPVSDVSVCCSPREKRIIDGSNKFGSKIFAQGSSWQSIDRSPNTINEETIQYDFLVLLNDTAEKESADFQKRLLCDLGNIDAKVLVRYRPQSAHLDKIVLQDYTKGMTISSGTTLKEDIQSSKIVVCFSEDAIFECFRNNKKVLFLVQDEKWYDFSVEKSNNMRIMSCATYDNYILNQLLNSDVCDYTKDGFVRFNFGDFEFDKVKNNINKILNSL